MGIPGYFSHIIKNYPNIIRNLQYFTNGCKIQHLFMDCNSIVYDSYHELCKTEDFKKLDEFGIESVIIKSVIDGIKNYILRSRPSETVMITFDGVAPLAKMEQQRTRRYRSDFISNIAIHSDSPTKKWNTAAITPGTKFMEKLSKAIEYEFQYSEKKYNVKRVIVSCSTSPGEGEHKIMEYIRHSGNMKEDTVAVYGLDSDLIMLSIFHLDYCRNIYVFREATEFLKSSIPSSVISDISNLYFLDIAQLSTFILKEMNCQFSEKWRIYDYVFICFLLGNDFLPHFPALNIRTHGIQTLLDMYRKYIGSSAMRTLISPQKKIVWRNVHMFLNELAKIEQTLLLNEYSVREKWDKRTFLEKTDAEREEILQNMPMLYRGEEQYICPKEMGWEDRYYSTLFHKGVDKQGICMNYIEGLEWVFKYYTTGCIHWRWKYNYGYPPLLSDLVKYVPHFEMDFFREDVNNNASFSHYLQLAYVLPKSQFCLLDSKIKTFLLQNYSEYFPESYHFQWTFCRYFWESHPLLPEIPVSLLEQWNTQFIMSQECR